METTLRPATGVAAGRARQIKPNGPTPAPVNRLQQSLRTGAPPVAIFILFVIAWQALCSVLNIPHYLLPKPTDVVAAAIDKADVLGTALASTFTSALIGLGLAVVCGMSAALVMSQSWSVDEQEFGRQVAAVRQRLGEDNLYLGFTFTRRNGVTLNVGSVGLLPHATAASIQTAMDVCRSEGVYVKNPHTYVLEDGGQVDNIDKIVTWKRALDPDNLLKPGKLRSVA